jgi:hypothetical protein
MGCRSNYSGLAARAGDDRIGRLRSGPAVNGLWGLLNVVGAFFLLTPDAHRSRGTWDDDPRVVRIDTER